MTGPRLPDGFAVQVDRRVKVLGEGSALLGGSPTRLLRLAPAAQTMLNGGRLEVHDAVSAQLARTLLDATVAHPRPASGPSHRDVTVVVPVRNNISGLLRLVGTLRGMRVVVVDDGSATPVQQSDFSDMHCDIQVLHHGRERHRQPRRRGLGGEFSEGAGLTGEGWRQVALRVESGKGRRRKGAPACRGMAISDSRNSLATVVSASQKPRRQPPQAAAMKPASVWSRRSAIRRAW